MPALSYANEPEQAKLYYVVIVLCSVRLSHGPRRETNELFLRLHGSVPASSNLGKVSKLLCQLSLHIMLTPQTPSIVEREVGKLPYFSLIW